MARVRCAIAWLLFASAGVLAQETERATVVCVEEELRGQPALVEHLEKARAILRVPRVEDYPRAVRMLRQVEVVVQALPEGALERRVRLGSSPWLSWHDGRAALLEQVRAELAWVEADVQTRLARLAAAQGEVELAARLLRLVETCPVLGPVALEGVKEERAAIRWPVEPAAEGETVLALGGERVAAGHTLALLDPASGRAMHLRFKDPAALRVTRLDEHDERPAPDGPTLIDLLATGTAPEEPER